MLANQIEEVKGLDVIIDSRLVLAIHIKQVVVRGNVRANLIQKCFISRVVFTLIRAFKVYVTPPLEYASCTWSPPPNAKNKANRVSTEKVYKETSWLLEF
jgi:hypothetical protein